MARHKASAVLEVLQAVSSSQCPAHSQAFGGYRILQPNVTAGSLRRSHSDGQTTEYAFEMATSNIRYGEGVTREVGMDVVNLGIKHICVFTDPNLARLPPLKAVLDSLHSSSVNYSVFDKVSIEPTNTSFEEAISFVRERGFDGFLAVGGGSVMDTAKAANLYSCYPDADFLDFVNAPIGKGLPIDKRLHPLICVPTTAGTGSETTGVSIFDHKPLGAKTGIGDRALRPLLGIVDPLHTRYMPTNVAAYSGFDVLCHALESFTAIPYTERTPRPSNPLNRPAYQGSNPISDLWSTHALKIIKKYFKRSVFDADDQEARSAMHLASVYAGVGFGNAGVHLPHGMSYPISGLVKSFRAEGYDQSKPLVPHGLSVVISAPAVFTFTAPLCPERHLEAAELLGADITSAKLEDAGLILADALRGYMQAMGVMNGLRELGYSIEDVPSLVKGTLPQQRVTKLSPRSFTEEQLAGMFENSMTVY
ncbi:hydroxyacid-oxoacid transhydrogenase, mitochondrial-like isoform X2 [Halichondria panicea]|uniref:hydroxyacid-oxoacid transhydrogenase, mitochondrial-like isoform X2 n=1 Tax=Halichondria panicea TaxID=6063 RepID=UPI00312B61B6